MRIGQIELYEKKAREQLEKARENIEGYRSPAFDSGGSSGGAINPDKVGDLVALHEEYYEIWLQEATRLQREKNKAITLIEKLENLDYRLILTSRYLEGETIEAVAEMIGRTPVWTSQLITRALAAFDVILKGEKDEKKISQTL